MTPEERAKLIEEIAIRLHGCIDLEQDRGAYPYFHFAEARKVLEAFVKTLTAAPAYYEVGSVEDLKDCEHKETRERFIPDIEFRQAECVNCGKLVPPKE